ncbi:MAG: FAD-dependent monooxygenase [Glutamicibacter sp.]
MKVGGGPAGMAAGLMLARSGVPVAVHEKHREFLRDFRGGTICPSTLYVLDELGLVGEFEESGSAKLPRQVVRSPTDRRQPFLTCRECSSLFDSLPWRHSGVSAIY